MECFQFFLFGLVWLVSSLVVGVVGILIGCWFASLTTYRTS